MPLWSGTKVHLAQANLNDTKTLGEQNYFPGNPNCFLPQPIVGPDDTFEPPPWFLRVIIVVAVVPSRPPTNKASDRFDVSKKEVAEHNAILLWEVH